MKFRPLQDWALIQRLDAEEKTRGGIIIPDTAKEKPAEGIVVSIGPGRYTPDKKEKNKKIFVPTTLQPGQRVIYAKYMATEIDLDNEALTLVREEDILGIFQETNQITVKERYAIKEKKAQPVATKEKASLSPARRTSEKSISGKKAVSKKTTKGTTKKKATVKKAAKKTKIKKSSLPKKKAAKKTKKKKK